MDRLTSMKVFVRVVELGSFSAAASALDLSGPMVGKHIRFLEARLTGLLLNRTTRRQNLTELGRAYFERCRVVLAEADASDALAEEHLGEPQGLLRVSMPALLGRHCVAPVLLAFARKFPHLELELSLGDRVGDLLADRVDLAVRTGDLTSRSDLVARRLGRQKMMVFGAPSYVEPRALLRSPQHLGLHETIAYCRSGKIHPWLFPSGEDLTEAVVPRGRLRADDMDVLADMAVQGLGLAWLPSWLAAPRVLSGELVAVLPDFPFPYDVHALWARTSHLPRKVRLAVDALVAELPNRIG